MVKASIKYDGNINLANNEGDTPLHQAASLGHIQLVNALLENGANVNLTNNYGDTPLHQAASLGHTEVVSTLIEYSADVNLANNEGQTPLSWAAYPGYTEIVRALLEAGANVNLANNDGTTPLYWVLKAILDADANVNIAINDETTPLYWVTNGGHSEILKALINNGGDVNKPAEDSLTLFSHLIRKGWANIIELAFGKNDALLSQCRDKESPYGKEKIIKDVIAKMDADRSPFARIEGFGRDLGVYINRFLTFQDARHLSHTSKESTPTPNFTNKNAP